MNKFGFLIFLLSLFSSVQATGEATTRTINGVPYDVLSGDYDKRLEILRETHKVLDAKDLRRKALENHSPKRVDEIASRRRISKSAFTELSDFLNDEFKGLFGLDEKIIESLNGKKKSYIDSGDPRILAGELDQILKSTLDIFHTEKASFKGSDNPRVQRRFIARLSPLYERAKDILSLIHLLGFTDEGMAQIQKIIDDALGIELLAKIQQKSPGITLQKSDVCLLIREGLGELGILAEHPDITRLLEGNIRQYHFEDKISVFSGVFEFICDQLVKKIIMAYSKYSKSAEDRQLFDELTLRYSNMFELVALTKAIGFGPEERIFNVLKGSIIENGALELRILSELQRGAEDAVAG
ncbi:hypothetical protein KAW80_00540 [Candidatus Babeliales bacterium]|nr:hypothetical protein [Candidatus Babeliales bacterium]